MNTHKKINIANTITYLCGAFLCAYAITGLVKAWYFNDQTIDTGAHWIVCAFGIVTMFFSMFASDEQKKSRKQ